MNYARLFTLLFLVFVVLVALTGQAFSATYAAVGSCTPPNAAAHTYATIQPAVTSSRAGTIIEVCPGTYPEQVAIDKSLTVEGVSSAGQDAAVIVPPSGGMVANATDVDSSEAIAAQILVFGSATVTISNLTVDGTGSSGNGINGCSPDLVGVLFQNANGTLNHVAVRNQALASGLAGCQSGLSILVQTSPGFTSKVSVANSSVHNYNKNGITGNDAGTTLNLTGNYVRGNGVVLGAAAQNGIQLGFGATGTIITETVIDNVYQDATTAAADILLYDAEENGGIKVTSNILGNSQIPIGIYTDTTPGTFGDGVTASGNRIFGTSTYDAIDVCTSGNAVTTNTIFNSSESGVHFDTSCGAGVNNNGTGNTMVESTCAGILDDSGGSGGNTYLTETYYTVPFPVAFNTSSCPVPAVAQPNGRHTSKVSPVGRTR